MAHTESFDEIAEDVRGSARDAIGKAAREVKKVNAQLMDGARDRADRVTAIVEKQGRVALSGLQQTVRERPALAVSAAAGAGLILGLLLSARR